MGNIFKNFGVSDRVVVLLMHWLLNQGLSQQLETTAIQFSLVENTETLIAACQVPCAKASCIQISRTSSPPLEISEHPVSSELMSKVCLEHGYAICKTMNPRAACLAKVTTLSLELHFPECGLTRLGQIGQCSSFVAPVTNFTCSYFCEDAAGRLLLIPSVAGVTIVGRTKLTCLIRGDATNKTASIRLNGTPLTPEVSGRDAMNQMQLYHSFVGLVAYSLDKSKVKDELHVTAYVPRVLPGQLLFACQVTSPAGKSERKEIAVGSGSISDANRHVSEEPRTDAVLGTREVIGLIVAVVTVVGIVVAVVVVYHKCRRRRRDDIPTLNDSTMKYVPVVATA